MQLPTGQDVCQMMLDAAARQVATTREGQAIIAAGLEAELKRLIRHIAGNAAMVVAGAYDEALDRDA